MFTQKIKNSQGVQNREKERNKGYYIDKHINKQVFI